jgi:hypothetical protein
LCFVTAAVAGSRLRRVSPKPAPQASILAAGSGDDFVCLAIYKVRHPSLDLLERAVAEMRPGRLDKD